MWALGRAVQRADCARVRGRRYADPQGIRRILKNRYRQVPADGDLAGLNYHITSENRENYKSQDGTHYGVSGYHPSRAKETLPTYWSEETIGGWSTDLCRVRPADHEHPDYQSGRTADDVRYRYT